MEFRFSGTDTQDAIFERIREERARQDQKFPDDTNLALKQWLTILVEEVGEVAKAILEKDIEEYEVELIQTAAVAVAALEDLWQT